MHSPPRGPSRDPQQELLLGVACAGAQSFGPVAMFMSALRGHVHRACARWAHGAARRSSIGKRPRTRMKIMAKLGENIYRSTAVWR